MLIDQRILLTDVKEGLGHQLLHKLLAENVTVYGMLKDFENIQVLQDEFPTVIPILLDVNKNWINTCKLLEVLPSMNHIVNYAGVNFADEIQKQAAFSHQQSYNTMEMPSNEFNIEKIMSSLNDGAENEDDETGFLINVISVNDEESLEAASSNTQNFSPRKSVTKLFKRIVDSNSPNVLKRQRKADAIEDASTSQPLTRHPERQCPKPKEKRNKFVQFLMNLFCCFGCFFNKSENENPLARRRDLFIEEDETIRKCLTKLHQKSDLTWKSMVKKLNGIQEKKLNDLVIEVNKWKVKERKIRMKIVDSQNASTLSRSESLTLNLAERIIASRQAQVDKGVNWDADKKYEERKHTIVNMTAVEKGKMWEDHYYDMLQKQFEALRNIRKKYKPKFNDLEKKISAYKK